MSIYFNNFMLHPVLREVMQASMLPVTSIRDLALLKSVSKKFYLFVAEDKNSQKKLDFPTNLSLVVNWADKQIFYINQGFLNYRDIEIAPKEAPRFSLQTVLNVATWLRTNGDSVPIPAHALNTFQARSLKATSYICGMNGPKTSGIADPTRIYFHLWKVKGSPFNVDNQYGKKSFHDLDGFSSTDVEKAEACERYVLDCFLAVYPNGNYIPSTD